MRSGRCRSSLRLMVWSAHIHCVWVSLTLRSWPSCTISRSLGLLAEGGKLPAIASMNPLCQSLVTRMRKLCSCLEEAVALFPGGKSQGCDSLLVLIFFFLVRPETHLSPTVASCPCFRLPVLKTVYCMNEAEMVDVALGILIEGRKQEERSEQPALAGADKAELSPICSASPSSPGSSEDEDNGKDALPPGHSPSQGPAGSDSGCSRSPEEDEDVLKYVREIFFS
ncbi:PREDICTED: modulator of retrovirus infection homolog isoform X1 [Ceratotherium simum simum]|uniref:Modulator of retrovirus infection homolog isoform X1 n=1 Tax=Ceratotherium simum simum TaxID=73337 RepID=A0ABM1CUK3_CERSS|nr:PREDICTED: modulator of retrovirus infection homolog isoform X1 [Ceratotherium simum simum]